MEGSKGGSQAAARIASALASAARGFARGGPTGAVAGAAASFFPEIIKAAVIVLLALLLLPTVVLAAIPNIFFGYDSAKDEEIIALTEQARTIDAAYQDVQRFNREAIDRIIAETQSAYSDAEGAQYDEVEVSEETDNTNIYWFIAISSVAHQQDLYRMDADGIRQMTVGKLTHTAGIVNITTGEGEAASTIRKLKIDIEDLDPEALMRKLGFSDEEEMWARTLYATLSEEQYVGVEDGDSLYGTNYGDISFTDAGMEVVYYNQTDERWGNKMYGMSGTIGQAGCGPTALAIVVSTLTGKTVTPLDVAEWSVASGHRCEGNGSFHSLIPDGAIHYGLQVEAIGRSGDKLVEALEDGKLVVGIYAPGHFTQSGHFLVIRGCTAEGKILVADPASYTRSQQEWPLSIIVNETSRRAGAGGPFWVISAKE